MIKNYQRKSLIRNIIRTRLRDYHAARRRCDWLAQQTAQGKQIDALIRDAAERGGEWLTLDYHPNCVPETEVKLLFCAGIAYEVRLGCDRLALREYKSRRLLYLAFGRDVWIFEPGRWVVDLERLLYGTGEDA